MDLQINAPAKINLALDVVGKLDNGYHLVKMVMQTISLADKIGLSKAKQTKIIVDNPQIPTGEGNLAYKAWQLMAETYGLSYGVEIQIAKLIPMGGGLAGGSTDAAAVMLGVNQLFGLYRPIAELAALAVKLGADVPFCLLKNTAVAQGIGEKLTSLKPCPKLWLVLINPGFEVNTAKVYQRLNWQQIPVHPDVDAMVKAIESQDNCGVLAHLGNVLEYPAFELFPVLADIKARLAGLGLNAILSGSGGTVLGLTADEELALWAKNRIQDKDSVNYPFIAIANTENLW